MICTPIRSTRRRRVTSERRGNGLLLGASVFIVMKAFASGGSALTGTEAISNGVSVFRPPESRNARITLVIMGLVLGSLVLGIAALAAIVHPVPYVLGTPTVLAQVAKYVYGPARSRHALYLLLQAGTMLILVLAANTSFTGFPFLASFAAEDSYLPAPAHARGATGWCSPRGSSCSPWRRWLCCSSPTPSSTTSSPLYAIGVFTGFTMAGAGMVKYHLTHREPHWRRGVAINGTPRCCRSSSPHLCRHQVHRRGLGRRRSHASRRASFFCACTGSMSGGRSSSRQGASQACEAPVLRHHVVVVLVDRMDLATARAIQYARTLSPDHLRAVHFAVDPLESGPLEHDWSRLGLSRLPLDIIDCPDRRLARAALELAAEITRDGDTELTMLLPRRGFAAGWRRLLHDRSADRIAAAVGHLPHVNATIVPFQLLGGWSRTRATTSLEDAGRTAPGAVLGRRRQGARPPRFRHHAHRRRPVASAGAGGGEDQISPGSQRGGDGQPRVHPRRRHRCDPAWSSRAGGGSPGSQQGARLVAQGMVGAWEGRLAILNPDYELIAGPDTKEVDIGV